MPDPKMEGVEKRLHEKTDPIEVDTEKQRRETSIMDIPDQIDVVLTPPRALINVLHSDSAGLCGQRFQLRWESGPWKDLPVTGYCAEPLCINEGVCTGTRFVPHVDQWTSSDPTFRERRTMTPAEMVTASRTFAGKAAAQTGRNEERTDQEIFDHIKLVWLRTLQSIRDKGSEWRR